MLDRLLPEVQSREISRPDVCPSPDPFFRALHAVTLSDMPLVRELVAPPCCPQPIAKRGWTDGTPQRARPTLGGGGTELSKRAVIRGGGQRVSISDRMKWRRQ